MQALHKLEQSQILTFNQQQKEISLLTDKLEQLTNKVEELSSSKLDQLTNKVEELGSSQVVSSFQENTKQCLTTLHNDWKLCLDKVQQNIIADTKKLYSTQQYVIKTTLFNNYRYNIVQLKKHPEVLSEIGADWLKQEEEKMLGQWYAERTGNTIDFRNPQTYNEKIQWCKIYDRDDLKWLCEDKYKVRAWVEAKIGSKYLTNILGVWDSWDDIPFDDLPNSFVIKCTQGCGNNIVVKDKHELNIEEAKKQFELKITEGLKINSKVLIEEYLENSEDDLYDYKFWCFNGKVEYISFYTGRNDTLKRCFYDREWTPQDFALNYIEAPASVLKPNNLDVMIEIAEKLAKDFIHVRVDLYHLNDGQIKFGEMTFTPANGIGKWYPPETDAQLGKLFILPPTPEIICCDYLEEGNI